MEGPHIAHAESVLVDLAQCLTEGEHAIEQVQVEAKKFSRPAVRAVMRVMQQSAETELFFQCEDGINDARVIPFVDDNDVSVAKLRLEMRFESGVILIEEDAQIRKRFSEVIDGGDGLMLLALHQV